MKILVEVCLHFERGVVLKDKNYSILENIYMYIHLNRELIKLVLLCLGLQMLFIWNFEMLATNVQK